MSEPRRRRVGAVSAPCRRIREKIKKRDTAGHRNPARRTRSGVRHVSDTDTTPKMACPCNLAFCALNYNPCYTLHSNVNFTIMFDKNFEHVTRRCLLLKWHKVKRPKPHLPNQLKFKNFFHYFLPSSLSLACVCSSSSPQLKICVTLNPQNKIINSTTTTPPLRHHHGHFGYLVPMN